MAKKPAESDEASSDETGSASEAGSGSESGAASGSSDDTEAHEDPKASKKTGKQASIKATKATAVRPAPSAPPRPRGSGHELVPVICSECYEDLVFDSGVPSDVLTCPICEHQAGRPDDAQLAVIADKRSQEKTGFIIGLLLSLVSVAAYGFWLMAIRNPHVNANENGPMFYGPVVLAGLTFAGALGFAVGKYESNRHDVYF